VREDLLKMDTPLKADTVKTASSLKSDMQHSHTELRADIRALHETDSKVRERVAILESRKQA
jgi:hypothetical protein